MPLFLSAHIQSTGSNSTFLPSSSAPTLLHATIILAQLAKQCPNWSSCFLLVCHDGVHPGLAPFQLQDLRKGHLLVLPLESVQRTRLPMAPGLLQLASSLCLKAPLQGFSGLLL